MDKEKGLKNVGAGLIAQVVSIVLGIVIPRLVLVNLGSEANGLLSSITNILTYLSLLEAGVGSATIQALYKPIAENDKNQINRIISATHFFYRRTGFIYFIIVLLLSICYAIFISSSIPRLYIFIVVFISGFSGVLSYFFQGKLKILLSAEGKRYVTSNISTITQTGVSLSKAAVLLLGGNVVAVQISYFIWNLIQMLAFMIYFKRHYKWLNYNVEPDFDAISQRNAVLVHQIAYLIFNNTDVLLLTLFASLEEVSVYTIYSMIYGEIKTIAVVTDGFLYALGQNYHHKEKFLRLFDVYQVYTMALTTCLFCITRILILPFLQVYTRGVTDINYIDRYLPWLFASFYLLHNGRQSSMNLIDIAQKFEATKWHAVVEAVINLGVSLILTPFFGIYGVLIGTIIALLFRTNIAIVYASGIMERSPWITYRRWLTNLTLFCATSILVEHVQVELNNYYKLFVAGVLLLIVMLPVFFLVGSCIEREVAVNAIEIIKPRIKGPHIKGRE